MFCIQETKCSEKDLPKVSRDTPSSGRGLAVGVALIDCFFSPNWRFPVTIVTGIVLIRKDTVALGNY